MSATELASLVERLEKVAGRLESVAKSGANVSSSDSSEDAAFVKAYDEIMNGPLANHMSAAEVIGGLVNEQAKLFKSTMEAGRGILLLASKYSKPSANDQADLLKPMLEKLTAIQDLKEKNRRSEFFNHLSAVSEGVPALGWVAVQTPVSYVEQMAESAMFYTNRVLKDYKEKGDEHKKWAQSLILTLKELKPYVKEYHTTGVSWNPAGPPASASAVTPSRSGGPPPPPPPSGLAPPPPPPSAAPVASEAAPDTSALFAELNKGAEITSGLKKVTKDMQTHKNPALRAGPAPFKPTTAPKPVSAAKAPVKPVAKPPLVELQGKKWVVEHLVDNHTTVIDDTNAKQTVYIFKCTNSTIQVKGKINSITLDSCKKTAVVFDNAISMVEFVNCQSVRAQVMGKVPTVGIEKTDGCQIYLSKESLDTTFISAKSSEMNVVVPKADGDYAEYAIAEQFRTVFNGSTLVTEVNDIAA